MIRSGENVSWLTHSTTAIINILHPHQVIGILVNKQIIINERHMIVDGTHVLGEVNYFFWGVALAHTLWTSKTVDCRCTASEKENQTMFQNNVKPANMD